MTQKLSSLFPAAWLIVTRRSNLSAGSDREPVDRGIGAASGLDRCTLVYLAQEKEEEEERESKRERFDFRYA